MTAMSAPEEAPLTAGFGADVGAGVGPVGAGVGARLGGRGRRQAHERLAADAAPAPRTRLAHPCLAIGDEYTPDHARDLVYVGTGNAGGCEALVGRLNHADEECPPGFCGRLAVPFSGQFYGAGNYWYTASHLGIASDDGARVLSGSDYRAAAREACARPWSWHKNQFAGAEWACALRPRRHDRAPPQRLARRLDERVAAVRGRAPAAGPRASLGRRYRLVKRRPAR